MGCLVASTPTFDLTNSFSVSALIRPRPSHTPSGYQFGLCISLGRYPKLDTKTLIPYVLCDKLSSAKKGPWACIASMKAE